MGHCVAFDSLIVERVETAGYRFSFMQVRHFLPARQTAFDHGTNSRLDRMDTMHAMLMLP